MNCPSCGAALQETARFCGSCGQTFRDTRAPDGPGAAARPSSAMTSPAKGGLGAMELISAGFEASKPVFGTLIVGSFALGFATLLACITIVGVFATPALLSGMVVVSLLVASSRPVAIGDFFKGMRLFVPLLLLGVVTGFLTQLGYWFFFLPGLYLSFVWMLAPYVMIDRGLDFWPAMEMSRQAIHQKLGEVVVFSIVIGLLNAIPSVFTVGLSFIVTGPITVVAMAILYDRLIGIEGGAEKL